MEPTTSAVVQPTATFRIQVSPGPTAKGSYRAATEEASAPESGTQPSYTWNAFLNDKPVFDKILDLPLERLISRSGPEALAPPSYERYGDPYVARALSEAIFSSDIREMASAFRSFLDEHDGYVRVQLQIDGGDSDVHDLPWEYLAVPWSDDQPLAADERTPFARTMYRQTPGFRPVDALPVKMLIVFEDALVEDSHAVGKTKMTKAVVRQAMDALSDLTTTGALHLTLLTGLAVADDTMDLSSSQVEIVNASLSAFRAKLGQYQIAHFVLALPAEQSTEELWWRKGFLARLGLDRRQQAGNVSESLGMLLSAALHLPPFLVLPTEFARQGQSGQLVDFMDQGVAAVLELPVTAMDRYWTGMQLFYDRLFEHGVLDIAANQLRRFWLKNAKAFPPQLPILWTAVEDGRLFARPVGYAGGHGVAKPAAEAGTTSAGSEQAAATPLQPDAGPAQERGLEETPQQAAEPSQQPAPPVPETEQPDRAAPAGSEEKPSQEEAAPVEKPSQEEGAPAKKPTVPEATAEPKEAAKTSRSTKPPKSTQPVEQPKKARRRPGEDRAASEPAAPTGEPGQQPVPAPRAPVELPLQVAAPAGPPAPAAGGVTNVQVGAVNINQVVFPMERYEPPAPDNVMTIRVSKDTVLLQFDAKDGTPTDYTSRNLLADEAYRQEILKANNDPRRCGNLLFNAIIHNDPGPLGQIEVTTEKGWDLALQKTGKNLRIELILDKTSPDNLQMHEYRWEYLRRDARTPVALLPRSPFYRRLAQAGGPLLVDKNQQKLKVLVAICSPSAQARASFGLIGALPPIQVGMEKEIATLALDRLERAGLVEKRILPEDPEQAVTRQMLLDAVKDDFHVLHLVCHGVFVGDNPPGDYFLAIEGAQGQPPFVGAEDVGVWMNAATKLRLVVLAACQSAVSSSGDALRGLGPRLVLNGQAPAVIAMQQKLPFPTAQLFMQSFYDDLARSGRVDMALAATRQTIFDQEGGDSGTWAIPVLFMSARDGQLIETDKDRAGSLLPPVPDIRTYRQLGASEDPQLAALNQTLTNEAQAIGAQHLVGAFQRAARSTLAGPSAPLAMRQDRERLTRDLNLKARVTDTEMRDFVKRATGRVKVEGGVERRIGGLELPIDAYRQIAATLNKGKHIILIGAPGTGKTTLAQAICKYAQTKQLCTGATVATATADWTTFDTVGGYVPTSEQTLEFRAGSFLQAIGRGEWLVIDEINRAEIDKAFGELFTVLSGQRVDTPHMVGPHRVCVLPPTRFDESDQVPERWIPKSEITPDGYEYVVHPNWRIIGTMNVYDRSALYSLSLAFMRRFAFIDLDLPANYIALCGEWIGDDGRITSEADRTALQDSLRDLLDRGSVLMQRRALGPAIVRDMIGHVGERYAPGEDVVALLAEAFLLYAAPQLDGLDPTAILEIHKWLQKVFGGAAEDKHILKRIADLYPFVSFAKPKTTAGRRS